MNKAFAFHQLDKLEQQDRHRELEETKHLRTYGYAPGGYLCKCRDEDCPSTDGLRRTDGSGELVTGTFIGDKRAWRCRPCAEKMHASELEERRKVRQPTRAPQLVRDKMVPREGYKELNECVSDPIAVMGLTQKLFLECAELCCDLAKPEEYGDVIEVLYALADKHGVTRQAIVQSMRAKSGVKGGFAENNLWIPEDYVNE